MKAIVFAILLLCSLTFAKQLYNTNKSYVTPITDLNFEKQVNKIRQTTKYVIILHFYKYNDGESKDFAPRFDEFTNEFRGVFRIGSVDCDEFAKICEKEQVSKYPTIKMYPSYPIPPIDYEGPLDTKQILNQAAKYVGSNILEVTPDNINAFLGENPSVPKVLLFSEKKGFPLIYKGLSIEFEKKLSFGIIRAEHGALADRYNVKSYPKVIVIKTTEKKPQVYTGEMKFQPLFEFLNIFSEVFVPGGGSAQDSAATKHWLLEVVPELNTKSANDICLKVEGAICAVLVHNGDKPDNSLIDELKKLHAQYERKIDRGMVFKFMWMNGAQEKKWAGALNFEGDTKLYFLNLGRRKRYLLHEGSLTRDSIQTTMEKITGGDARFSKMPDELPEFTFLK